MANPDILPLWQMLRNTSHKIPMSSLATDSFLSIYHFCLHRKVWYYISIDPMCYENVNLSFMSIVRRNKTSNNYQSFRYFFLQVYVYGYSV